MAPIHDTDIAEKRWEESRWTHYEFWERIEQRIRKKKFLWVIFAGVVFSILSSVPVFVDRLPKWRSLAATREIAEVLSHLKTEGALRKITLKLVFEDEGKLLHYRIEQMRSCDGEAIAVLERGQFSSESARLTLVSQQKGLQMGIPGLADSFCYSPIDGYSGQSAPLVGFGIIPVMDLTDSRLDRMSVVFVRGPSAKISFN